MIYQSAHDAEKMKITKSVIPSVIYLLLANSTSWTLARIPASFRIGKRSRHTRRLITSALKTKEFYLSFQKIIFLAKNEVGFLFLKGILHENNAHTESHLCYSTLSRNNVDKSVDF